MPVNHFFNHFSKVKTSEQHLYDDLIAESIRINGHDIYYLPREHWSETDKIYGENLQSIFQRAYVIEMYIANVKGFEGDNDFFGKFGLEIRDTSNFIVSRKSFTKHIPTNVTIRPREGDLLFVPVLNRIFEIKFVEEELFFFTKGNKSPYVFELKAELFRWNHEKLETGVSTIDSLDDRVTYTIKMPVSGTGTFNIGEIVYQGANLANSTASAKVSNWDNTNQELYVVEIKGSFESGSNIIGTVSNTSMTITDLDTLGDNVFYDMFDNRDLEDEANSFVDFSESNIFGSP